jgi:transcription elongation factor Elf1
VCVRVRVCVCVCVWCRPTVPTVFKCPFCHHDDAVECKLDMKVKLGSLTCRMCNAAYQTQINCE